MEEEFKVTNVYEYVMENKDRVELGVKEGKITAIKGTLGEKVVTYTNNNFQETTNEVGIDPISKAIDWIVTQESGEKMVVKDGRFNQLYTKDNNLNNNEYTPIKTVRPLIQVRDNIQFVAPWCNIQYLKKGGYLVILTQKNIYGIQKGEFDASYQKINLLNRKEASQILDDNLTKTD